MRARSSHPITRYFKRLEKNNQLNIFYDYTYISFFIYLFASFLQAFERRPYTVNEQIKIFHDFLDVSRHITY
jgi:hypothetical protein